MRNIISFNGRITRKEYIVSYALYTILYTILTNIIASTSSVVAILLGALFLLVGIYVLAAQVVKRAHDCGYSGKAAIIPLFALYLLFAEGDLGENEYGEEPTIF